jgi:hypothetical protein
MTLADIDPGQAPALITLKATSIPSRRVVLLVAEDKSDDWSN